MTLRQVKNLLPCLKTYKTYIILSWLLQKLQLSQDTHKVSRLRRYAIGREFCRPLKPCPHESTSYAFHRAYREIRQLWGYEVKDVRQCFLNVTGVVDDPAHNSRHWFYRSSDYSWSLRWKRIIAAELERMLQPTWNNGSRCSEILKTASIYRHEHWIHEHQLLTWMPGTGQRLRYRSKRKSCCRQECLIVRKSLQPNWL